MNAESDGPVSRKSNGLVSTKEGIALAMGALGVLAIFSFPVIRMTGFISWPWFVVLMPFTLIGAGLAIYFVRFSITGFFRGSQGQPVEGRAYHDELADLKKKAIKDRDAIVHLRRANDRLQERLEKTQKNLDEARASKETVRRTAHQARQDGRESGRAEQQHVIENLHGVLDRERQAAGRSQHRLEEESAKLVANVEALSQERDMLEQALLSAGATNDVAENLVTQDLAGLRVLLVGGDSGHVPPIREYMEKLGVTLLHEVDELATDLVANSSLVVLWTRFMSHSVYHAFKRECRSRGVQYLYWNCTSPVSLSHLIAEVAAGITLKNNLE